MPREAILNYSTTIAAEKTVGEIQRLLAEAKAKAILTNYEDGVLVEISFQILHPLFGLLSFRLPNNVDKVFALLSRNHKIPNKYRTKEQAARVAWRIVKDWVEAQLAMIQAELATIEQVFLPYVQNHKGETLYDTMLGGGFKKLSAPD